MKYFSGILVAAGFLVCSLIIVQYSVKPVYGDEDHGMMMDINGMVMNENMTNIPEKCSNLVTDQSFLVIADSQSKSKVPGTTFSFYPRVFEVSPCTRITITFENRDKVRHQWMVHGLPRFMYNGGMFHMEANGQKTVTGTFIVPFDDKTYLIHCDISQHMQKGMKGMLIVGDGSGKISGVPGETGYFFAEEGRLSITLVSIIFLFTLLLIFFFLRQKS